MTKKLLCAVLALAGLAAALASPADAAGMNGTVLANAIDVANGRELNGHDLGALTRAAGSSPIPDAAGLAQVIGWLARVEHPTRAAPPSRRQRSRM